MNKFKKDTIKIFLLTASALQFFLYNSSAQTKAFSVSKTSFCSSVGDDFSPVFYKNGIVYCSNAIGTAAVSIKSDNENLFNILFVEEKDSGEWKSPELFSPELTTILNEGPATFTAGGDTIYYARNNLTVGKLREINKASNKLGIYSAVLVNGIWTDITPLPFINPGYSYGTPALSPDGNRLYFASDMPGGEGGSDIYYSEKVNGKWTKPANAGSVINTSFDEAYPYVSPSGLLFFSSNGHNSLGGKDIFYTWQENGKWVEPLHPGADINSNADDYGIITDLNFETGYFSSNRKGNTNIYSFKALYPQFGICEKQDFFNQCYRFFDERFTDSLHLDYQWFFGNGILKKGISVEQCFSHPGKYTAILIIKHHLADSIFDTYSTYNFEVGPPQTPAVFADGACIANTPVKFGVSADNNPKSPPGYFWDFGNGYLSKGATASNTFKLPGIYTINLGVQKSKNSSGICPRKCYSQQLQIFDDLQQLAQAEATLSRTDIFENPTNYKELGLRSNSYRIVNYYIGKFEGIENFRLVRSLDSLTQNILAFDDNYKLLSGSQGMLNYYIGLLNQQPGLILIVAVHQDNSGKAPDNKEITERIAKEIRNYLQQRVVNNNRIKCTGYGDSRPLSGKNNQNGKLINKRIEFILVQSTGTAIK